MRKGDFVAQFVDFMRFDHLPVFRGMGLEAARVTAAHIDVGSPYDLMASVIWPVAGRVDPLVTSAFSGRTV